MSTLPIPPRRAVRAAALGAGVGLLGGVLAGACADSSDAPPFVAAADSRQLMLSVLEPAAEVYWDAVGFIWDMEGTHEIEPRTAEEWEAVENAAWVLAESGNLLLLQERVQGDHWVAMSRSMIGIGMRAVEAAQARDADRVFEVGGDVYLVCTGCHAVYATETLRPNYDTIPDSIPDTP